MDTDLDGMIKDEKDVHLEGETMSLISNKIRLFLIQWLFFWWWSLFPSQWACNPYELFFRSQLEPQASDCHLSKKEVKLLFSNLSDINR